MQCSVLSSWDGIRTGREIRGCIEISWIADKISQLLKMAYESVAAAYIRSVCKLRFGTHHFFHFAYRKKGVDGVSGDSRPNSIQYSIHMDIPCESINFTNV